MPRGGKREGAGRKEGIPNSTTTELKLAILKAFDEVGGAQYLTQVAKDNPQVFCTLLSKVLPRDVNAEVNFRTMVKRIDLTGDNGSGD